MSRKQRKGKTWWCPICEHKRIAYNFRIKIFLCSFCNTHFPPHSFEDERGGEKLMEVSI